MALNSLTDKLSGDIDYVVTRRQQNWDYLKRAHQGEVHWLNVLHLSKSVINKSIPTEKLVKRIRRWFLLGLSLGRLLELSEGATLVCALTQLIEEYEHFIGAKKDMASSDTEAHDPSSSSSSLLPSSSRDIGQGHILVYLASAHGYAQAQVIGALAAQSQAAAAAAAPTTTQEHIKPTLKKVGKEVVYEYLQTHATCLPEQLDYCEVVHSLCDVLSLIYAKFLDPSCQPTLIRDAILRLDRKLKQLILTKITSDLSNEVAAPALKREMNQMLNHMFVDEKMSNPGPTKKFIQLEEGMEEGLEDDEE